MANRRKLAEVIPITSALAPKGCEWRVRHITYGKKVVNGVSYDSPVHVCFIFNYDKGLTAFEAWQLCNFPGNPPFYECTFEQLCSYPCNTKRELLIHGNHRTYLPKTERVSSIIAGENSSLSPKVSHTP